MRREKLNEYMLDIIFGAVLTFIVFLGIKEDIPFIATAFAASIYLSFINPYSKYSTPWNISASYVTAAVYGIILYNILRHEYATNSLFYIAAIFLTFTLFAETITIIKAEHPPAAAVLISFAYTEATLSNIALFSILIAMMVIIDYIFEQLLEHKKDLMRATGCEIKMLQDKILKNISIDNKDYKPQKQNTNNGASHNQRR
ncbi:MAG: HPP family protein [archaeon]